MKFRSERAVVTFAIALLGAAAVFGPAAVTLQVAREQSLDDRQDEADRLAREVLAKADTTTQQAWAGTKLLEEAGASDPCSSDQLARMTRIVLTSEQLQGAGYVKNDYLLCSTARVAGPALYVGPPNYVSSKGGTMRSPVKLPGMGDIGYILAGLPSGYVVLVHPKLTVDLFAIRDGAGVGILDGKGQHAINRRGEFRQDWSTSYFEDGRSAFVTDHYAVRMYRSRVGDYVVYAAVPIDGNEEVYRYAIYLVPFCLLAIGALIFALTRLARIENSFPTVISRAFAKNEFHIEYQPVVELANGRWIGAEALLRWTRPTGEQVGPDHFIPMAEQAGVIRGVTKRVLELIAADVSPNIAALGSFYITVNVSAADLADDEILGLIRNYLDASGSRPDQVLIEATERSLMDVGRVAQVLKRIRAMGLRVAIDDFGTGYSSLAYLDRLSLDLIKIDKSFVGSTQTEAATSHVVTHIIEMARSLQLGVIAEGVETEAQAGYLRSGGVEYGQGWLFAKPMRWADLLAKMEAGR